MRRSLLALGVAAALGGPAAGQVTPLGGPGARNNLAPAMPGQVVGTGIQLSPAGTQMTPAVPPRAELKKLESPYMRLQDPNDPYAAFKGTGLSKDQLVAPLMPAPGGSPPNILDRLNDKLKSVTNFFRPSPPSTPTYTPGISRRNRERAMERMWRRD